MKPSINADMDELKRQMARGGQSGGATSGNIMPGANAMSSMARAPSGGGSSMIQGIPSRTGRPPFGQGSYKTITGSPAGSTAAIKPGSVPGRKALGGASHTPHALALGHVAGLMKMHGSHPVHGPALRSMQAHHSAQLKASKFTKQPMGPKFGSLGGSSVPGAGANVGSKPLGMAKLPDEM